MPLLGALVAVIVEALAAFFTRAVVMKVVIACGVYVFLFTIIPLLLSFLVPDAIKQAVSGWEQMLQSGVGLNIAFLLNWFQAFTGLEILFVCLAVRFLFRRI